MVATIKLNNGIEMPKIGYGVYQISPQTTEQSVLAALKAGYRMIDTAQYYGNESGVGAAIKASGIPRNQIFITTKVQSNRNVAQLLDQSLKNLQTDYLDLVLIHWVMGHDEQTYQIMEDYYRQGKIRALGLSNFYGTDLTNILTHAEVMPAVNQLETHIFYQHRDLKPIYQKYDIKLEAWAPFGEGRQGMFNNPVLLQISQHHHKSVAQVILRFLIQNDIIVIPKSVHVARMSENLNVFDFSLTNDEMALITQLDRSESLFGWY